jgi:hypothetical protein
MTASRISTEIRLATVCEISFAQWRSAKCRIH